MSVRIDVPAAGALFEGHFPGRPILPGVAALALVARALAPDGTAAGVREIPYVRFREPVLPGDRLEVRATPRDGGPTRFTALRDGRVVANGEMLFGRPGPADRPGASFAARAPRDVPPLDDLVPHRAPMRFVTALVGEADDGVTCRARIPAACALVEGGAAPALAAIEAAAQAAAAWEALRRSREAGAAAGPRVGYLVSARDVAFHRGTVPAESDFHVSIRLEAFTPPLATYAIEAVVEGEVALRGAIGTYLTP